MFGYLKMKKFCKSFADEFQCRNFGLEYSNVDEFYRSQWQTGERSLLYLIYRWLWCIFFVGVLIVTLTLSWNDGKVFIFLTNWGIILCTVANICAAILVTRWHFDIGGTRTTPLPYTIESNTSVEKIQHTPRLVKFYWLTFGVSLHLALIITTVYWLFLYGKMEKPQRFPVLSFVCHCLNSVFMIIDFWMIAFPVRLLHLIYAMLSPIIYCLFSVVYYFAGGTDEFGYPYIYFILNWKYPDRGLITFAGVFLLYIIYGFIIFSLSKLRRILHEGLKRWKPHSVDLY